MNGKSVLRVLGLAAVLLFAGCDGDEACQRLFSHNLLRKEFCVTLVVSGAYVLAEFPFWM